MPEDWLDHQKPPPQQQQQQQQQECRRGSWAVGDDEDAEAEEVLANLVEAAANQAEGAILAEVVRGRIQKEADQQDVVVDPKVDDDEAFRVEAVEDVENDYAYMYKNNNMRQGDGREREDHP